MNICIFNLITFYLKKTSVSTTLVNKVTDAQEVEFHKIKVRALKLLALKVAAYGKCTHLLVLQDIPQLNQVVVLIVMQYLIM